MSRIVSWRSAALLVVIAALVGGGVGGYHLERGARQVDYLFGDERPDRIELDVTLQRVDVVARELDLRLTVIPHGKYADQDVLPIPSQDLTVDTSSLTSGTLRYPAHDRVSGQDVRIAVNSGVVSDYPFDSYTAPIGFFVEAGGQPVPESLTFRTYDSFFIATVPGGTSENGSLVASIQAGRSLSTSALAWFLMVAMWALALAVLAAAITIVGRRMGLVWPALGWMAATLFALVGFRNAAPGSPPIGALIDYGAFFWAELLTTVSLVYVVVGGLRVTWSKPA